MEKEKKKKEKREKVRDRLKMLEEMKKPAEEKENEKRKAFMENWKEKEKRKKKQEIIQKGWKDLMESVEHWEELAEGTDDWKENKVVWKTEVWTAEGFQVAGKVLEDFLTEVMAFTYLRILLDRTVQANKPEHQISPTSGNNHPNLEKKQPYQETDKKKNCGRYCPTKHQQDTKGQDSPTKLQTSEEYKER